MLVIWAAATLRKSKRIPSVLRDRLAELVDAGILDTDEDGRYGLTGDGRRLLVALRPLSRWAEDWGRTTR